MGQMSKIIVRNKLMGRILAGIAAALLATATCTAICAIAISKEMITQEKMGYCAIFILLISSLCASIVSTVKDNERRIGTTLATGVIYTGMLLMMNALFFDGKYQGVVATIVVIITGSLLPILLGRKGMKKGRSHRSNKRHR